MVGIIVLTKTSRCFLHPSEPAIGRCSECHRPVCKKCSTLVHGKLACRNTAHHQGREKVDADEAERQERLDRAREERRKGHT